MCCCCGGFLKTLKIWVEITIFIFVIILCTLSSKEPFKYHIIGDMSNYFKIPSTPSDSAENISITDIILMNSSYISEKIFQGNLNNSYDIIHTKDLLKEKRKLTSNSFCVDMEESFKRNKGQKLSYIFDLKYQTIRKLNIALIIVILSFILLFIAMIILLISLKNNEKTFLRIILGIVNILLFLAWIAKFVLSLILLYFIESSDIGKYDDFLDCENVQVKFFDKFTDIDKLRKTFLSFAVLNIISESLDKADELCNSFQRDNKPVNVDSKINVTTNNL